MVSGPPVMRSPEQWDAAGFAATERARPLRRGGEVHRFSELAAHEDQLPPEDAEELYRFRIRRVLITPSAAGAVPDARRPSAPSDK